MKKIFFPNLDGLRFIAFFMVYLWHAFEDAFTSLGIENVYINNLFYTFANGKTGVSIFFVLSGFLITYLILSEINFKGRLDVKSFYIRRSLRIWPLYYLVLLIIFILIPMVIKLMHLDWGKYDMNPLMYVIYLSNFDVLRIYQQGGNDFLPSTVTWSVAIEEQFYLVWPLLFAFTNPKFIKWIFPAVLVSSYLFRMMNYQDEDVLYFHTFSVCGDLALGGYAAWLSLYNKTFLSYFKYQSKTVRIFSYLAGIIMLYVLQLWQSGYMYAFGRLFQTAFFTYIILDQNFSGSTWLKFSNSKFMSRLGKYTYGLYLFHPLVLVLLTTVIAKVFHIDIGNTLNLFVIGLAAFPLSVIISYLSYRYFESRFLKLKMKFAYISK